jgi:hypothetical protein
MPRSVEGYGKNVFINCPFDPPYKSPRNLEPAVTWGW